jgi:Holliday junction resolvase RusA-like endonuclease
MPLEERRSMQYKVILPGKLPNLNDYLKAERQTFRKNGKFTTKGNEMKQNSQDLIIWQIRQQLRGLHINNQIDIHYMFYEPNPKRDKDNVASFCMKVFQDSLVLAGVIDNDGWKNINGFMHEFAVDKNNPRIEFLLTEVD